MATPHAQAQPQRIVRSGSETRHQPTRLFLASLSVLLLFIAFQLLSPVVRVGDGMEYYGLFFAWTETFRPWMSEASFRAYEALHQSGAVMGTLGREFLQDAFPALRLGETADFNHFWMYSLLAAVMHWTLDLVGIDAGPQTSFHVLHLVFMGLVMWIGSAAHGWKGFLSVLLLIAGSPVLWYVNKVHTEFLTVTMAVGAAALVARNHLSFAALLVSLAATQNPGLSVVAVVLLAIRVFADWKKVYSRWEVAAIGASLLLLAAHPAYYWFRYNTITPQLLAGGASLGESLGSSLIWLFDPDVGLFPNWPLGFVLAVAGAWALASREAIRAKFPFPGRLVAAGVVFAAMSMFSHASTTNLNSGATPGLARYALWYIALVYPFSVAALVLMAGLERRRKVIGGSLLGAAVVGSVLFVVGTPHKSYWTPSTVSRIVQRYLPWAYDPPAEIFGERYSGYGELPTSLLAVVGPDCSKVLVFPGQPADGVATVPARCSFRPSQIKAWANAQSATIVQPTYMSIAADNIVDAPPLEIGRSYAFNSITDGLELSGWSTPEATHVWSKGTDSRLVLDLPPGTDSLHCLFLNGFSLGPQTISSFVNGLQAGETRLDGEGEISVPLKLSAGRTDVRLSFSNPHVPGNGDPRLLAFALRALKVENCAK